ncbi:MAG: hypothetical protein RL212_1463 [Pseudomonadota bacterium]|jgi:hypothetical protein
MKCIKSLLAISLLIPSIVCTKEIKIAAVEFNPVERNLQTNLDGETNLQYLNKYICRLFAKLNLNSQLAY